MLTFLWSRYIIYYVGSIRKSPKEFGEAFSSWTLETLRQQIEEQLLNDCSISTNPNNTQCDKSISVSTIRRILREAGWKCRSLKDLYKSNAPSEEEKKKRLSNIAKEILKDKEKLPDNKVVLSVDESHWNLVPRRGKVWTPPEVEQLSFDISFAIMPFCLDRTTNYEKLFNEIKKSLEKCEPDFILNDHVK